MGLFRARKWPRHCCLRTVFQGKPCLSHRLVVLLWRGQEMVNPSASALNNPWMLNHLVTTEETSILLQEAYKPWGDCYIWISTEGGVPGERDTLSLITMGKSFCGQPESLLCKNAGCGLDQGSNWWSYPCPWVPTPFKQPSNHGLLPVLEPLQLLILIMQDIWGKGKG